MAIKIIKSATKEVDTKTSVKASDVSGLANPYEYMQLEEITSSDIPVTPSGNLASTNIQDALVELQTHIDSVELGSGTVETTISSNFTINNAKITSQNGIKAYKYGDIVHIHGQFGFNSSFDPSEFTLTDLTIPSGYRPTATIVYSIPAIRSNVGGLTSLACTVDSLGNMGFSFYAGDSGTTYTSGQGFVYINISYNIATA